MNVIKTNITEFFDVLRGPDNQTHSNCASGARSIFNSGVGIVPFLMHWCGSQRGPFMRIFKLG